MRHADPMTGTIMQPVRARARARGLNNLETIIEKRGVSIASSAIVSGDTKGTVAPRLGLAAPPRPRTGGVQRCGRSSSSLEAGWVSTRTRASEVLHMK
jgi:hypothetical protein